MASAHKKEVEVRHHNKDKVAALVVRVKRTVSLHLPPKCLADIPTAVRRELQALLGKFLSSTSSATSTTTISVGDWQAMPLGFAWDKVQIPTTASLLYDNPWLQLIVKVPFWLFIPPPLGTMLCGTLLMQDGIQGLKLTVNLSSEHLLNVENKCQIEDRLKKVEIPVLITTENLRPIYQWDAKERAFGQKKIVDELQFPKKLLSGCNVSFYVAGHTCDADGNNYCLLGSLSSK